MSTTSTSEPPGGGSEPAVIDGHRLARGAATNVLVLLAANFRGVFTFLIARTLGQAALGRFGVAFALTELLSKVGNFGLDSAIVPVLANRVTAGDGTGSRRLFQRAIVFALVITVPLAVIAVPAVRWIAASWHLEAFTGGMTLMLFALPGIALSRISTGASRAVLSMRSELYSRGVAETWVTTGVFVLAVALGLRDAAPAIAVVIGTTAGGVAAYGLARRAMAAVADMHAPAGCSFREMLRFSAPIAGSNLVNVLIMQIDVLLLGAFVGRAPGVTVEVFGVFCAAAEIAGGMRKVRQVLDPIFAPVAATRFSDAGHGALRDLVMGPGRWMLAVQLPLAGILLLASGSVLSIYGPGFRDGARWLALLGLAHCAGSFAGLVETLFMIERPSFNLVNAIVTVAIQLVSGLLLIPRLGVTGAALAMCVGFGAQGVLRFAEVRHVFGWSWPWASLRRPLAAFGCAFVPAALMRLPLDGGLAGDLLAGGVFLALYGTVWRVIGLDPLDREVWRVLTSRRIHASAPGRGAPAATCRVPGRM